MLKSSECDLIKIISGKTQLELELITSELSTELDAMRMLLIKGEE